jgi:protein-S-isoprenylcysteine O-methyltransferase Ste14
MLSENLFEDDTMNGDMAFRILFVLAFLAMMTIRVYYQWKVLRAKDEIKIRENSVSLAAGSIAALTTIVFGAEYIFQPGLFSFAYILHYPYWLRWPGALALIGGIILLASSHRHLGRSFHSLVMSKGNQVLVKTGPYRWVRHPIYTAYLLAYIGGGLASSNLVLTAIPPTMFAIMVSMRMGREEEVLKERFGQEYSKYMQQTGRLLPRLRRHV